MEASGGQMLVVGLLTDLGNTMFCKKKKEMEASGGQILVVGLLTDLGNTMFCKKKRPKRELLNGQAH
jgi:hypothetical protein